MTETRRARMAEKAARNADRIVIEDMPDVDLEIIDEVEDPPIHRLVKIRHTQHGRYITKCQQCNRETRRNTNADENMCFATRAGNRNVLINGIALMAMNLFQI